MSYSTPTPHEIRISNNLQKIANKLGKLFVKETGGEVDFILCVSSKSERETVLSSDMQDAPVGSYVSTMTRETAALSMMELLAKWEANKDMPPIHELKDANGRSLDEILGAGPH